MSAQPIEIRMAHLEGAYEQISERLRGIDGRLTVLDQKIDSRFDTLDKRLTTLGIVGPIVGATLFAANVGAIGALHR